MLHFLVDWAQRWDWRSEGLSPGSFIEAVRRGQRIGLYQDAGRTDWWPPHQQLPGNIERLADLTLSSGYDLLVLITDRLIDRRQFVCPALIYRPRTLTLGVSGPAVQEAETFDQAVRHFFDQQGLSLASLTALAIAKHAPGREMFLDWADWQSIPVLEYSPDRLALLKPADEALRQHERSWQTEAAAMLAASVRTILVPATVCQLWTFAVARRQTG